MIAKYYLAISLLIFSNSVFADTFSDEIQLPEIGDPSGNLLSPAQEKRFGDAFLRFIQRSSHVFEDPEIHEYIQNLGHKLVNHSDEPSRSFNFFIVKDPIINAFAGPNGNIGVHSGLFLMTQSESELSSVMAHEIAHVTQHHLFRQFDAAQRLNLPATAAILGAILLGSQNSELGAAALAGVTAGSAQLQINFTRANEKEADRVGIKTLAKAGYDPRSMPTFFEQLQSANRYSSGKEIPEFLRTHPVTLNRIADSRSRAEQYKVKQQPDPLEYFLIRVKLQIATSSNPNADLAYYKNALAQKRYLNREAAEYGYALSLKNVKKYNQAREAIGRLLKDNPEQIHFWIALGEIEIAANRPNKALLVFKKTYKMYPDSEPIVFHYASNLITSGQPLKARKILMEFVEYHSVSPIFLKLIGRASGLAGFRVDGHQYFGAYYFSIGATKSAIKQIEIALKIPDLNFYQSSRLESILKVYKAVLKQEKEDQG